MNVLHRIQAVFSPLRVSEAHGYTLKVCIYTEHGKNHL
jgi:hypothetical protein